MKAVEKVHGVERDVRETPRTPRFREGSSTV